MNIFLAPHNDDEALFGSFIIQRTHPLVVIVTDGIQHEEKFNISADRRRDESKLGCMALGVDVHMIQFMGLSDKDLDYDILKKELRQLEQKYRAITGLVFAPSVTGGSPHHDMISVVAREIWRDKVMFYGTYSRENFTPVGEMAIHGTDVERANKDRALACYSSQIGLNKPHFDAVKDQPEYLSFKP